ncbi:MAG: sulfate transporter CysZ [Gammaproteobacteria bacterium]|jgi:CysZ protein|nr:sulfate transporter CysZ [Gammaproteobacteria bacterium]MBQ0773579.1 sulfate transporter CysZ [Gammaproteobacteria bacterium]
MTQAFSALNYLLRAWRLAREKPLLPWVVIPALFNLILFGGLYYLAGSALSTWISSWAGASITGFWSFLAPVVDFLISATIVLVWILLLALFASFFTIAVQLIAAPFMGLLAERVDHRICASELAPESTGAMILRTFSRELRKTWDWLWRSVLVLIVVAVVWLIPGVNIFASVIWFLWSGWLLGVQYIDYGADTRQTSFHDMKRALRTKKVLVLSFGCAVLALTMIPLLNLLIMPVAVIAGTMIWLETLSGLPIKHSDPLAEQLTKQSGDGKIEQDHRDTKRLS